MSIKDVINNPKAEREWIERAKKTAADYFAGATYDVAGKTGTAEKLPRGNEKYLVSYAGFAPYDNPQLLIYCIVDEPNSSDQPHSYYAQNIVREILEEIYPYMNIYPDEELTGKNANLDITGTDPCFKGERDGDYLPQQN